MRGVSVSATEHGLDSQVWALQRRSSEIFGRCQLCQHKTDPAKTHLRHCESHERSNTHQENVIKLHLSDPSASLLQALDQHNTFTLSDRCVSDAYIIPDKQKQLINKATIGLLASLNARFQNSSPPSEDQLSTATPAEIPLLPPHWLEQHTFGIYADTPEPHQFNETEAEAVQDLTQTLLGMFAPADDNGDNETDCNSDSSKSLNEEMFNFWDEDNEDDIIGPDDVFDHGDTEPEEPSGGCKRQRMSEQSMRDQRWYLWPDQISCTLDILMHLPRSVFSQRQLDLFLWLLKVNGVNDVPSVYQMKAINQRLQQWIGVKMLQKTSAFGNVYYVNNFLQIIAQELGGPWVRSFLHFFSEDAGKHISESWHASRWLNESPDDLVPPMIRCSCQDFYVFELTKIWNHESGEEYCVPTCWFSRNERMFARCNVLRIANQGAEQGWVVLMKEIEVDETQLLLSFPRLCEGYHQSGIPDPQTVLGVWDEQTGELSPWNHPCSGNPWRAHAKGRRVWNKHNSFLFTLAGLSRKHSHKEYNVHFLCTSNIAGPLEMLDGIVDQLDQAQADSVSAWDCVLDEEVLVLPWVLTLLGDNPMQSEFAAHVGLVGKFFCQVCKVKGKDTLEEPSGRSQNSQPASPAPSVRHRIKDFIKSDTKCSKPDTHATLRHMLDSVIQTHSNGRLKTTVTATGVKDPFLLHYVDRIVSAGKKLYSSNKESAIRSFIETLPDDCTSPVWRLKGLDPHSDTPIEILHVVLLGFIKYLWRDVTQVQLKDKKAKLEELKHRLSSFDTSGLGFPTLNGNTLVKYSGSLVGRDFRCIAQVTPFVLHGMITPESYETWCCLSKLVPMIWQPVIEDIDEYCGQLKQEINAFLFSGMFKERDGDGKVIGECRWVGSGPRSILGVPNSIIPEYLGIPPLILDETAKGTCTNTDKPPGPFSATQTFKHHPTIFDETVVRNGQFQTAKSLMLSNGDPCPLEAHVVVCDQAHVSDVGPCFVGRVEEILRQVHHSGFGDTGLPTPDVILVEVADHQTVSPHYKMPLLQYTGLFIAADWKDLLAVVNTPHNCVSNKCGLTGSRSVYHECTLTSHIIPQVEHLSNPTEQVLNVAQLQNCTILAPFRVPTPQLTPTEVERIIKDSAERKAVSQAKHGKEKGPRPLSRPATPNSTINPVLADMTQASSQRHAASGSCVNVYSTPSSQPLPRSAEPAAATPMLLRPWDSTGIATTSMAVTTSFTSEGHSMPYRPIFNLPHNLQYTLNCRGVPGSQNHSVLYSEPTHSSVPQSH
ncbi:hypothetical protein Moror_3234 [Moniliophthora roreri MCA 2997]|uniref:Transposase domain-containing protein n=1 Tax=Moniliophthora roreri (strain MCA 2997) TaxID=1381753 RepID=V2WN93_MONRO|nr:hypothetical protein Moror_3234 [Moniliophthora roreri MCA 2997]